MTLWNRRRGRARGLSEVFRTIVETIPHRIDYFDEHLELDAGGQ